VPSLVPRCPGPAAVRMPRSPHPDKSQHPQSPSVIRDPWAGRLPSRALPLCQDTRKHRPAHPLPSQVPKLLGAGAAPRPAARAGPVPLAHLIQAVDFLRGIHDFSAAGALGVHCRGSHGRWLRRRRLGAPRSRCDIPRRAPRRLRAGGRASGAVRRGGEWARGSGRACLAGRDGGAAGPVAWGGPRSLGLRLSGSRARLRLGLRAAGSASLAPQVPVTHRHLRPPLAFTRSPAAVVAAQAKPTGAPRPKWQ
jgi:hypothetical protein